MSVFTYLSLQGTGYVFCFITLILQFTIPVVIIYSSIDEADYYNDPIENKDVAELLVSMFCVTDPGCKLKILYDASFLNVCVLTLQSFLCYIFIACKLLFEINYFMITNLDNSLHRYLKQINSLYWLALDNIYSFVYPTVISFQGYS